MSTPIEGLMNEALGNLKQMIDVNTIVGDVITTPDGTTIIPVSKVAFGFGAGGSEFGAKPSGEKSERTMFGEKSERTMFGGGCGGGVSVKPVAFLVVKNYSILLLPVSGTISTTDRIVDMIPEVLNKFNGFISDIKSKSKKNKSEAHTDELTNE